MDVVERIRRRREADKSRNRVVLAAAGSAVVAWFGAGRALFGHDWLVESLAYAGGGAAFGGIMGVGVVFYTLWVEFRALLSGETAVWSTGSPTLKSYLWTKGGFTLLTVLAGMLVGSLFTSMAMLLESLKESPERSAVLLGVTIAAAVAAGVLSRRKPRRTAAPVREVQTFDEPDAEEETPDFEAIAELDSFEA